MEMSGRYKNITRDKSFHFDGADEPGQSTGDGLIFQTALETTRRPQIRRNLCSASFTRQSLTRHHMILFP